MISDGEKPLFSFAIIADTHINDEAELTVDDINQRGKKAAGKYDDLVERVNTMGAAFVVHLGDITHPVPTSPEFEGAALEFQKVFEKFSMPYHLVPGNHDVGEKLHRALPELDEQVTITKNTIALYEQHFGPEKHSFEHQGCLFVMINSMLINSGLEEETAQWDWLEQTLRDYAGNRVFMFSHYPVYLSATNESDYYDNIDEPGRSRLLDLLGQYNVEGFYGGHVHNFFYNHLDNTHHFTLPSTVIVKHDCRDGIDQLVLPSTIVTRHDHLEFFRTAPSRETGRLDLVKTGFFWVDVYPDGHVPHFIRLTGGHNRITHSWENRGGALTMDLRVPWCEEADIPTPWGVEIFERKLLRNDYPLSALWEMGIRNFRIPISDLLNERVSRRVDELISLGHTFTVVMFGMPGEERQAALASHGSGIKAIEVVALFSQWQGLIEPLTSLREESTYKVYLNPVRPEAAGWTTNHGLHTDLTEEIDWALGLPDLKRAVDGFVFGVRQDVGPSDGFEAARSCLGDTDYQFILHVPCVGFVWTSDTPTDEASRVHELTRVAEAQLLARAHPDISIVADNFVELDRGYTNCRGLVDRLYNPKDGSRIVSSLDNLLPRRLGNPSVYETKQHRVVLCESDTGQVLLILANNETASRGFDDHLPDKVLNQQGKLIDLVTGEETDTSYSTLSARIAGGGRPQTPMLLVLNT
jgi:predicted phosphodiesterase